MVTLAQRLEALRVERGISRPALSAALGFPKTAVEKFETGRQTPSQDQQKKLASPSPISGARATTPPAGTAGWPAAYRRRSPSGLRSLRP